MTAIAPVSIATAELLDAVMQGLNVAGEEPTLLILDRNDMPYMAFGEERTEGGEAMTCWLTPPDPGSGDLRRPAEDWESDVLPAVQFPLSDAVYPVEIVGPRRALATMDTLTLAEWAAESGGGYL